MRGVEQLHPAQAALLDVPAVADRTAVVAVIVEAGVAVVGCRVVGRQQRIALHHIHRLRLDRLVELQGQHLDCLVVEGGLRHSDGHHVALLRVAGQLSLRFQQFAVGNLQGDLSLRRILAGEDQV